MKYVSILFILFISVSCSETTTEQKVQESVKKWIIENTNDPSKYEPIEFGTVEKLTDYEGKVFYGYKIRHKYREANSVGGVIIVEHYFYTNKSIETLRYENK